MTTNGRRCGGTEILRINVWLWSKAVLAVISAHDRFSTKNRHSSARIERLFRARSGCEQSQQRISLFDRRRARASQRQEQGGRERNLWKIRRSGHCGLIPANLTTLAHFSVSSAMILPNSAGEPASTVPPKSASCAFILESARPALISLLSLSMVSVGVFLGAPIPYHVLAS